MIEKIESGTVRIAFDDLGFAQAFISHFGGMQVPIEDVERAMNADTTAEDAYDRLAAEYDLED